MSTTAGDHLTLLTGFVTRVTAIEEQRWLSPPTLEGVSRGADGPVSMMWRQKCPIFEDRALSPAGAAPSRTLGGSSVEKAAILIGVFACVIGMLFLAAEGLSKSTDWYEPTPMSLVGP